MRIFLTSTNYLTNFVTRLTIHNSVKIVKRFTGKDKLPSKLLTVALNNTLPNVPKTPAIACASKTPQELFDLNNKIKDVTDANSLYNTMPRIPLLVYNPSKIKQQIEHNYVLKKHLPLYEKNDLYVPYVVETFPSYGISGSFTLSPIEREMLNNNDPVFTKSVAFILARYAIIMYGGTQDLFSQDNYAENFEYPLKHVHGIRPLFPMTQHHIAFDMYGLKIPVKELNYPSKFSITAKTITVQRDFEVYSISKSHDFVNDEIIIIDINNPKHKLLLDKYGSLIHNIAKQPEVDAVGSHTVIGTNEKLFYPIDTKIISHPEKNLDMLSSYSSRSPKYQSLDAASKMYGQLHNLNTKNKSDFLIDKLDSLQKETFNYKKKKITKDIFDTRFKEWCESFFHDQLKHNKKLSDNITFSSDGTMLTTKYSLLPSIITEAHKLPEQHYYAVIKKNNAQLLENMSKDIINNINLSEYYPTFEKYKKYDIYSTQLPFMLLLKKYGMIDNYYTYRKLLPIQDVHDC